MTMGQCHEFVSELERAVRNRDGVSEVQVKYETNSGLNRANQIVDRPVFRVKLLPAHKEEKEQIAFRQFFWKEAGRLNLSMEVLSLVIDDREEPMFDPPV